MKKNPELTAQTRQNLLDAFWALYETKPVNKITVNDVTNRAGYCRSTFYEYFHDIPEVLETWEDIIIGQCVGDISLLFPTTTMEQIHESVENIHRVHGHQFEVLLVKNKNMDFYLKMKKTIVDAVYGFAKCREEDVYARYVLEFAVAGYLNSFMYWYESGQKTPLDETGTVIFTLLRHGVLPEGKRFMKSDPMERLIFAR